MSGTVTAEDGAKEGIPPEYHSPARYLELICHLCRYSPLLVTVSAPAQAALQPLMRAVVQHYGSRQVCSLAGRKIAAATDPLQFLVFSVAAGLGLKQLPRDPIAARESILEAARTRMADGQSDPLLVMVADAGLLSASVLQGIAQLALMASHTISFCLMGDGNFAEQIKESPAVARCYRINIAVDEIQAPVVMPVSDSESVAPDSPVSNADSLEVDELVDDLGSVGALGSGNATVESVDHLSDVDFSGPVDGVPLAEGLADSLSEVKLRAMPVKAKAETVSRAGATDTGKRFFSDVSLACLPALLLKIKQRFLAGLSALVARMPSMQPRSNGAGETISGPSEHNKMLFPVVAAALFLTIVVVFLMYPGEEESGAPKVTRLESIDLDAPPPPVLVVAPAAATLPENRALASMDAGPQVAVTEVVESARQSGYVEQRASVQGPIQDAPPTKVVAPRAATPKPVFKPSSGRLAPLLDARSGYAIQLLGSSDRQGAEEFCEKWNPQIKGSLFWFETRHQGKPWFVVVTDVFPDKPAALAAAARLPAPLRTQSPWVRDITGIQEQINLVPGNKK